jgi:hypothetical protein
MRELLSRKLNHMQPGLAPASHRSSISNGASRRITSKQLQQNARPEQRFYTSARIRSKQHRCRCLGPPNAARANILIIARAGPPSLRCRAVVRAAWSGLLLWWQDGAAFLSTRCSWMAAIGRDDSSHMRPHRTVQPPPRTRGLQRRSPSHRFANGFSHGLRRVDAHSLCRLCRYTAACVNSIFSWVPEAIRQ